MWHKNNGFIYFFALALLGIAIVFIRINNSFFQQDEWLAFGRLIVLKREGIITIFKEAFLPTVGHFNPLKFLLLNLLFNIFGTNYAPYAFVSVILHIISTCLVYYFFRLIIQNRWVSILGAFFFGILAGGSQATTWIIADISIHGATIFGLLSVIYFIKHIEKHSGFRLYWLSLAFLIISLLLNEITIGLFLVLPCINYLYFKNKNIKDYKHSLIVLFIGFLYALSRGLMLLMPISYRLETLANKSQSLREIFINLIIMPVDSVVQSIIPTEILLWIAGKTASLLPKQLINDYSVAEFNIFVEKDILLIVTTFFFLMIVLFLFGLYKKCRNEYFRKAIVLGLFWVMINSLIFVFAPEKKGLLTIVEPRNLYFSSIGTVLFFTALIYKAFERKWYLFFIFPLLLLNIIFLNIHINNLVTEGKLRKNILIDIKRKYPILPEKVIFYTESDRSYYGLPQNERIMPFQSGFGQTLLVWYSTQHKFPYDFLQNKFLWGIEDQGYKELKNQGFGYFRDFYKLIKTVDNEKLPVESVISFRYDSESQILTDNTDEIRGRLKGYFSDKQEINPREIDILASTNPKDAGLTLDGKRNTYWSSKLPYAKSQFIQIKLNDFKKVTAINIDSYNNQDQNEVGYEIYISNDGNVWEKTFYSKRYPPGEDGIVNIYLLPKSARFVRIQQIGYHQYAPWVIHELKVYAVKN